MPAFVYPSIRLLLVILLAFSGVAAVPEPERSPLHLTTASPVDLPLGLINAMQRFPELQAAFPAIGLPSFEASEEKVTAPGESWETFGGAVALSDDGAMIGAIRKDIQGQVDQGAAYYFVRTPSGWKLQQILTAPDGDSFDYFGGDVAMLGNTAVIGAGNDEIDGNGSQGAAYVFTLSEGFWSLQAKLTASDGNVGDQFGSSIALNENRVIISAPLDSFEKDFTHYNQGSAYIFDFIDGAWSQQTKLIASDGDQYDYFGFSVALDDDTALISAPFARIGMGHGPGRAYVFTRSGTVWSQTARLTPPSAQIGDAVGYSVALADDVAVLGAPNDEINGHPSQGSVYVFTGKGSAWTLTAHFTASNAALCEQLGSYVTLSGDMLVAGAVLWRVPGRGHTGAALIYRSTGTIWTERALLTAEDGGELDHFGLSIDLVGDTLLIGTAWDDVGEFDEAGSAYIFTGAGDQWQQQAHLFGSEIEASSRFGAAVALAGDTAIVGIPGARVGLHAGQGAVYIFTRQAGAWQPLQKLTAADGQALNGFGRAAAIAGDTILIGARDAVYVFVRTENTWQPQVRLAPADSGGEFGASLALDGDTVVIGAPLDGGPGAVFVFTRSGATWTQAARLVVTDAAAGDDFGRSVALSGDTIAVGAPGKDAGSAYVFMRKNGAWSQQAHLSTADGGAGAAFGAALALEGDALLAGAPLAGVDGRACQGAVYAFARGEEGWAQQAKLLAAGGAAGDQFGGALALNHGRALVGAGPNAAVGYLFAHLGDSWPQIGQLAAIAGSEAEAYGASVALDGLGALVGAPEAGAGDVAQQGAAYFHTLTVNYPRLLPVLLNAE